MAETETPPADETVNDDADSLESSDDQADSLETSSDGSIDATSPAGKASAPPDEAPKKGGLKQKLRRFNIYLLLFLFILVIAGVIIVVAYFQSKKASTTSTLKTQNLTQQTLQQVANSDATVGNAQTVLNVESSAVFAGKVLIREGLEVAGNLQIGGTVGLNNIAVSGTSQLGQVFVSKDLAVSGNSAIQGSETVSKSLQVGSGGSFGGPVTAPQITTSNLQLNSDLALTHHVTTAGGQAGSSNGSALGSGGSSTVSGTDIAGTANVNTGSGAASGCFITIKFASHYANTPHILVTPVGSDAGGLAYYIQQSSTNFSICANNPPSGKSFSFNYFVID